MKKEIIAAQVTKKVSVAIEAAQENTTNNLLKEKKNQQYLHVRRLSSSMLPEGWEESGLEPSYVGYLQDAGISAKEFLQIPPQDKFTMRQKYEAQKTPSSTVCSSCAQSRFQSRAQTVQNTPGNSRRGSKEKCIPPEDSDERRQGAAECLTPEKLNAALQHILETRLENKDKKGHNGSALEYWPEVMEKAGGA